MKDIQNLPDHRRINIKKVGVKDISYPIKVLDKARHHQSSVATVNMYVNLPHHFKGTHMSRFVEILNRFHGSINIKSFHTILEEMKERLQAEDAHIEMEFSYFLKNETGQQGMVGINKYTCRMHGSLAQKDELTLNIQVPIYPPLTSQADDSLPSSLGRWGIADISFSFKHFIWIEDLIKMIEEVTLHDLDWSVAPCEATGRALSVESITHAIGKKLARNEDISRFTVTVKNLAVGYNTFATLEGP